MEQNQGIHKAQIPNPALNELGKLVGEWKTVGTHPDLPGKVLNGTASFNWMEGGAFLLWYSTMEEEGFPAGIAIFGSDDATGELFTIYFDERKVSRKYDVSVENNVVKRWRNAPGFMQRYSWTITDNGNTIISKGELCENGKTWKSDLNQTFTRIR
jgi:hypothetical protein